jgi:hypothetical protein
MTRIMMVLLTALLLSRSAPGFGARSAFEAGTQRHAGAASRALRLDAEHRGVLAWAVGYAVVALVCGAAGAAGIASGLSPSPLVHLLALSALTLAVSLVYGIAVMLAALASLPPQSPATTVRRRR